MNKKYLLAILTIFVICFLPLMSHGKLSTSKITVHAQSVGWQKVNGTWYYYNASGVKQTGWLKEGNTWYYLKSNGAMATGWEKVNGTWYYLEPSGAMKTGWLKEGSTWYYLKPSGAMAIGWEKVNGTWYYLEPSGAMKTGWLKEGSTWYYLKPSGAMATGWEKVNNVWYYFYNSGAMATNTTIDGWSIDGNGVAKPGSQPVYTGMSILNQLLNEGFWPGMAKNTVFWSPYGSDVVAAEYDVEVAALNGKYDLDMTVRIAGIDWDNCFIYANKVFTKIIPSGASTIVNALKAGKAGTWNFDGRKVLIRYPSHAIVEIYGKQ